MTRYRHRIRRGERLKSLLLSRLLRSVRFDFERRPLTVAIVGDYIGDEIRARGRYEDGYLRFLEETVFPPGKEGDALDIGANIGNHTLALCRHFRTVIAFEPNPVARSLLETNLRLNAVDNVRVEPLALSNSNGTARLLVKQGNLGASHLRTAREDSSAWRNSAEVEIKLAVGDERLGDADVRFIKLDVEGHEHAVLRGLQETIGRCRPAIMLEQLAEAIDGAAGTSPSHALLSGLGYSAFEIRSAGGAGFLRSLLEIVTGRTSQSLVKLERLERRNYPALLFLPQ
jgi:FkbM family methyltransferase